MHKEYKQKILEKAKGSIFSFFIRRKRIAYLMAVWILMAWAASAVMISKESAPKIDFWVASISTFYNWANAVDIDSLITDKIEKEIDDITWIKKISSTSRNSFSSISIEFDPNVDMNEKMNELRSWIDNVKKNLPDWSEDPEITRINSSLTPIFSLHLSWEVSNVLLKDHAEKLKDILEKNSAIEEVVVSWQWEREIFIDLDPLKLRQYNLTSLDIINWIKSANKDFPVWNFDVEWFEYNLRISWKYKDTYDIENTIIKSLSWEKWNSFISIWDVADIYEDFVKDETIQKLSVKDWENWEDLSKRLNTVTLSVKKSDKQNIFAVDSVARQIVSDYEEKNFNWEIRIDYLSEMSVDVSESYEIVFSNWIQSIIIVVFLMIFFIWFKEWLITWMIIPLSFLWTIAILFARWDTLSFMSNFSMILALWIIVDTAIVIVEWIHDWMKRWFTADEAAMLSVQEFKAPLFSWFLTTIAVFIPLLVLPWVMWKYLSFIPITVSLVLLSSLIISFLVIPAIAASILWRKNSEKNSDKNEDFNEKISFFWKINLFIEKKFLLLWKKYKFYLREKIPNKIFRRTMFFWVISAFVISLFLPVQFTMFPSDDVNYFSVSIKEEPWKNTLETQKISEEIEKKIAKYPEVKYVESWISDNSSSILVQLYEKEIREDKWQKTSIEITAELQKELKKYKNQNITISEQKKWPPGSSPVAFRVIVEDANKINEAQKTIEDLKNILKEIPWTSWVNDDLNNTPWEIKFVIDRWKALALWLNPDSIWTILRSAVEEIEATEIQSWWDDISVNVRYSREKIKNFDDILNIQLINSKWNSISLSQVVTQDLQSSLMNIKRVDWNIAITVSSQLSEWWNALEITNQTIEEIAKMDLPDWIIIDTAWENSENADLFVAMLLWFIAAIFLIFVILVVQFDSFIQPLVILFTIVMAQTWVNLWLFVTDTMRSMAFLIWSISLAWIVVNDAIIMIDRINNLTKENPHKKLSEIIAEAWESRLQPIILTTLTTTAWILPLMLVDSFWRWLSVTIVFWLMFASTMTLVVIPSMVYSIKNKQHNIDNLKSINENNNENKNENKNSDNK